MMNSVYPIGGLPQVVFKPEIVKDEKNVASDIFTTKPNVIFANNLKTDSVHKNQDVKPTFGKSFGKGMLFSLQQLIPFYGSYKIGKEMIEQDRLQEALETGKPLDTSKVGFFKAFAKGFGMKVVSSLPIIGSYKIGKEMIEQDRLKESIETGKPLDTSKVGFFKAWAKGIGTKLALSIPILNTYIIGKEIKEQDNMEQLLTPLK